jgi:hypothetical protein
VIFKFLATVLLLSGFANAEGTGPIFKPKFSEMVIWGQRYYLIETPMNDQIFIKQPKPKSPTVADAPTAENEYERLGIVNVDVGFTFGKPSNNSLDYSANGKNGELGEVLGNPGELTTLHNPAALGFDLGGTFRIPSHGRLRRFNTGFIFSIKGNGDCDMSGVGQLYADGTDTREYRSYACAHNLKQQLFGNWSAFSEYDVVIKRGSRTSTYAVGGAVINTLGNHTYGHELLPSQNHQEYGGVFSWNILASNPSTKSITYSGFKMRVIVTTHLTYLINVGITSPVIKIRIKPPRVEK